MASTIQKPRYNPKVKRAVKPPRRRKKAVDFVRANSNAINRLNKSVAALTMGSFGNMQKNFQEVTALVPTDSAPFCFDATDFTCQREDSTGLELQPGCKIYGVNLLGNNITVLNKWKLSSGAANNPFWDAPNADLVGDTGSYKPIMANYNFKVYAGRNRIDDVWVDIRLIAMKKSAVSMVQAPSASGFSERIMPRALIHMKALTDGSNAINSDYFKTYRHMRIYLNSQTNLTNPAPGPTSGQFGQTSTTGNSKFRQITIRPKGIRQQLQSFPNPNEAEGIGGAGDDVQDGSYGFRNVPIDQPLWCVISTNDQTIIDGDQVTVDIRRKVFWRDQMGGNSLASTGATVGAMTVGTQTFHGPIRV